MVRGRYDMRELSLKEALIEGNRVVCDLLLFIKNRKFIIEQPMLMLETRQGCIESDGVQQGRVALLDALRLRPSNSRQFEWGLAIRHFKYELGRAMPSSRVSNFALPGDLDDFFLLTQILVEQAALLRASYEATEAEPRYPDDNWQALPSKLKQNFYPFVVTGVEKVRLTLGERDYEMWLTDDCLLPMALVNNRPDIHTEYPSPVLELIKKGENEDAPCKRNQLPLVIDYFFAAGAI